MILRWSQLTRQMEINRRRAAATLFHRTVSARDAKRGGTELGIKEEKEKGVDISARYPGRKVS